MTKENLINMIKDELGHDLTSDDLIDMLIRAKRERESKSDLLRSTLEEAKVVRQMALNNARLKLQEALSPYHTNVIDDEAVQRLKKLAGITDKVNKEFKYNTGQSAMVGVCGTAGLMGTIGVCGTSGSSGNPGFSLSNPNCEIEYTENLDYLSDTYVSFDHLAESEFKESVKKLYESYKI